MKRHVSAARSGEKINGSYLRVEICVSKYNPNPLIFSHGGHLLAEERRALSSCLTASESLGKPCGRPFQRAMSTGEPSADGGAKPHPPRRAQRRF